MRFIQPDAVVQHRDAAVDSAHPTAEGGQHGETSHEPPDCIPRLLRLSRPMIPRARSSAPLTAGVKFPPLVGGGESRFRGTGHAWNSETIQQ